MKIQIPEEDKLRILFEKGVRIHRGIKLLQESIERREKEIKKLNKTKIMKEFRTHTLMISTTQHHIKAQYKKFKKLFEE